MSKVQSVPIHFLARRHSFVHTADEDYRIKQVHYANPQFQLLISYSFHETTIFQAYFKLWSLFCSAVLERQKQGAKTDTCCLYTASGVPTRFSVGTPSKLSLDLFRSEPMAPLTAARKLPMLGRPLSVPEPFPLCPESESLSDGTEKVNSVSDTGVMLPTLPLPLPVEGRATRRSIPARTSLLMAERR
jgi:hypothetical protein